MNEGYPQDPLERAVDETLEGEPRAAYYLRLVAALRDRRALVLRELERETDPAELAQLAKRVEELEEQIQVLSSEASVSKFVEDAVRFSYEMSRLEQD